MKVFLRILLGILVFLLLIGLFTIKSIDRSYYKNQLFYSTTMARMDSLESALPATEPGDTLLIGWSKISITPEEELPLAGYGARDPMAYSDVHDSIFVRSYVFNNRSYQKALISADLLIIHPEVRNRFFALAAENGWDPQDIFLSATHTHNSRGGWAPGLVGELFAGDFDPSQIDFLAEKLVTSLVTAQNQLKRGRLGFAELSVPTFVKNRLIKTEKGKTDPFLKLLYFESDSLSALHSIYSAHATCLSMDYREVSGDYPAAMIDYLEANDIVDFAGYSAGAVGSMGPADTDSKEWQKARDIGWGLAEQVRILQQVGFPSVDSIGLRSFRIPVDLRQPHFKISENLSLRPWLFNWAFGDYAAEIAAMQFGNLLIIGLPADFSGELALPLYEYASQRGMRLIITSFNGGYTGYIPKDDWYDLNKYETRTMSWYGPDNGAYFSELIRRVIDICAL